jgi:hypothetical protein
LSDFKVTVGVGGFVWADFQVGPPSFFADALGLDLTRELLESKAGLKQEFNLATAETQSSDAAYASNYSLAPFFSGGTSKYLQELIDGALGTMGLVIPPFTYSATGTAIAQSPAGSFQIIPPRVRAATTASPGDSAEFVVNLSRTNYLTMYAVESVELYRKQSNGSLTPAPGSCGSMTPSSSTQSLFTCKTTLPSTLAGSQTFFAFVKPKMLDLALPILLETSADARATVIVDTTNVVYETDFSGTVDTLWSHRTKETSPSGQQYLGRFTNEPVKLSLTNLPTHGKVKVELDLYIVKSWDGSNTTKPGNGPDIVTITVGDSTVLHSTFSNVNGVDDHRQSYPDRYPGPLHDAATGAFSKNTLGYTGGSDHHNKDSIYRLSFEVNHSVGSIVLQVKGTNLSPLPDEWWGLDNIRITVR